ncbi:MAG: hypothetical protein WC197_01485 [Candidatus Gastranaerophilaceae bacterium]|jgi:hypothetical protein
MSILTNLGTIITSKPKYTIAGVIAANMVCRPIITMSNKQVPEETRKYTAAREFCTELFGMITLFGIGSLFEYVGGQIAAKKITGKFLNKETFSKIGKTALEALSKDEGKIKTGVLIASFVGSIISSAIATPILNNVVLNKIMNKLTGKKDNAPESKEINPPKSDKQENIFTSENIAGNGSILNKFSHLSGNNS